MNNKIHGRDYIDITKVENALYDLLEWNHGIIAHALEISNMRVLESSGTSHKVEVDFEAEIETGHSEGLIEGKMLLFYENDEEFFEELEFRYKQKNM